MTRPTNRRDLFIRLAAALSGAVAAWVSRGALAFTNSATLHRIGLLPPIWELAAFVFVFVAITLWLCPNRSTCLPLFFSLVLFLPWVPLRGRPPAAFLMWSGHMTTAVWIAIAVGIFAGWQSRISTPRLRRIVANPARAPWLAFAVAFAVYAVAARHMDPRLPAGDEPEYLVVTQSILQDHDLQTENNYREHDYEEFTPIASPSVFDYLRLGRNGRLYSIHLPGLPVLVAPAYAVGGYSVVSLFLAFLSAVTCAFAWRAAYACTAEAAAAWFGWSATALSAPFLLHAFTVYPDVPAAAAVMLVIWFLCRPSETLCVRQLIVSGAALAFLPWLGQRFAMLSAAIALCLLLRLRHTHSPLRSSSAFLAVPAISAIGWFGYFWVIYASLSPWSPYGELMSTFESTKHVPTALLGMFFDQQFGLLSNAPVHVLALVGLLRFSRVNGLAADPSLSAASRVPAELGMVLLLYVFSLSMHASWWGASGVPPARFFVPLLPVLAIPTALVWSRARSRAARTCYTAALTVSLMIAAALLTVHHGELALNNRLVPWDLLLDWLTPVVDLTTAAPSALRDSAPITLLKTVIWLVSLGAGVFMLFRLQRRGDISRGAFALAACVAFAAAVMSAAEAIWHASSSPAITAATAQQHLLGWYDGNDQHIGVRYRPLQVIRTETVSGAMSIDAFTRPLQRRPGALMLLPYTPAGIYRLTVETRRLAAGTLTLLVGPGWWPIRTIALDDRSTVTSEQFQLPVSVGSLAIVADPDSSPLIRELTVRPLTVTHKRDRVVNGTPAKAMQYGATTAYFMNRAPFVEPTGFWIPPGRDIWVVLQLPGDDITLSLRNVPTANRLAVATDGWAETFTLQPDESRSVIIPSDRRHLGTLIRLHAAKGVKPSDVDPLSEDDRTLATWVQP